MDTAWRLRAKNIEEHLIGDKARSISASYEGVSVEVDREDKDCLTLFFEVPSAGGTTLDVEISIYDLSKDGIVLSLEADAADNDAAFDDAAQIAEDLADQLGGQSIDV